MRQKLSRSTSLAPLRQPGTGRLRPAEGLQLGKRVSCSVSAPAPERAQGQQLKTVDEAAWNDKYSAYGTLACGVSLIQGRRESMEDTAVVIPKARCGYMFTGKQEVPDACRTPSALSCTAFMLMEPFSHTLRLMTGFCFGMLALA